MTAAELAILVGAFLTGAAGLVASISTSRAAASKSQLEIMSTTLSMLMTDNKRLTQRVENLECELEERDGSLAQVKQWAELLVAQVRSLGGTPVPMPDKEKTKPKGGSK